MTPRRSGEKTANGRPRPFRVQYWRMNGVHNIHYFGDNVNNDAGYEQARTFYLQHVLEQVLETRQATRVSFERLCSSGEYAVIFESKTEYPSY